MPSPSPSPSPSRSNPDPGTYIRSFVECSRTYDDTGAGFALFVTANNMPTGRIIPKPVITLLQEAYAQRPAYVPFGSPEGAWAAAEAARKARQAELVNAAQQLLADHDMDAAA